MNRFLVHPTLLTRFPLKLTSDITVAHLSQLTDNTDTLLLKFTLCWISLISLMPFIWSRIPNRRAHLVISSLFPQMVTVVRPCFWLPWPFRGYWAQSVAWILPSQPWGCALGGRLQVKHPSSHYIKGASAVNMTPHLAQVEAVSTVLPPLPHCRGCLLSTSLWTHDVYFLPWATIQCYVHTGQRLCASREGIPLRWRIWVRVEHIPGSSKSALILTSPHVLPELPCSYLQPPHQQGPVGGWASGVLCMCVLRKREWWGSGAPQVLSWATTSPQQREPGLLHHWCLTFVTTNEPIK